MSEPTPEATETDAPEIPTVDPTETVEFWREQARKQEKRAKENASAAKRLGEIDEANKTAEQRSTDALAAAEKRAIDAESRLARADVAAAKGLPPSLAVRLVGTTREELEADADELLKLLPAASTAPPPLPHGYGTKPSAAKPDDGNDWLRAKARR